MEKIYCISGLGADHRIFKKLAIPGYELAPVPWPPYDKHDEVKCYAQKISALIPGENPIILGVSFGGMIAIEIAKQRNVRKVFLVSSAKTISELEDPGGFVKTLIITGIVPASFFSMPNKFLIERFGATTADEKEMLTGIFKDTDGHFMKWALKALLAWDNTIIPNNVVHMHGTADKIIPPALVRPDYWIEGGTHIMVYNRADTISKLISSNL